MFEGRREEVEGMVAVELGAGVVERPERFVREEPENGFGAAGCIDETEADIPGGGRFCMLGATGAADWKSSKSSSSVAPDWNELKAASGPELCGPLPFELVVVAGVKVSSPTESRSTSGSFFTGGSGLFFGGFSLADCFELSPRRAGLATAPSSYSSYSSNRSRRGAVSWKPDVFPPKPPPSPYTPPL